MTQSSWPRALLFDLAHNNAVVLLEVDFTVWHQSQ